MPARVSAGLVIYRLRNGRCEVFLAHPGGPYFAHKDDGHWTIPKGEIEPGEDLLAAARREFREETGIAIDAGATFIPLGFIRLSMRGRWNGTGTIPGQSKATSSKWSGRPVLARRRNF